MSTIESENDALVPRAQAALENGVSTKTIRRWEQEGQLPPPVRISSHAYHSRKSLNAWIARKVAEAPLEEARRAVRESAKKLAVTQ